MALEFVIANANRVFLQAASRTREERLDRNMFDALPEGKAVKNRLHIDLRPKDQAAEVARLEALGARRVDVGQGPETTWVVLADPDDNEFCVLRALRPEELAAAQEA